jgi:hypothetical protein
MKSNSKHKSDLLTDVARAIGSSLGTVVARTSALTEPAGRAATKGRVSKAHTKKTRRQTAGTRRSSPSASRTSGKKQQKKKAKRAVMR